MQQNRDMGICVSHEIYVDICMYFMWLIVVCGNLSWFLQTKIVDLLVCDSSACSQDVSFT